MANSLAIQEHVAYFLSGIVEAVRWPTIYSIIARSPSVQRTLLKSFLLNGVIYLGTLFLLEEVYNSPNHKILGYSYASITGYPMYLLCLLANSRYYARTAKETFNAYTDHAQEYDESLSSMGSLITMAVFYMNCAAFVALIRSIPVIGPFVAFIIQCIITSFYCFDYKWSFLGWSMEQRLAYSEQHWSFFCGFGLPVSGLTFFLSTLRAGGVFALVYPFYIIMATTASVKPLQAVSTFKLPPNRYSTTLPARIPVFLPIELVTRAVVQLLLKLGVTSVQSTVVENKDHLGKLV